ncbi:hypothetical protein HMPREF1427_00928 [Helicobacter pylori GAM83Bi]|nr:hypothetical protein HMPREF1427_00928 [Helicobacter pylori GAM83Bi]EMH38073.1 hypothetical protein HMPREF1428_01359 [Helicobacter pylori GAM83T]
MIVLKNAQSLFKRVRNSFKRVRISHQASDPFYNPMKTPQNSKITPLFKEPLSVLGLGNALRN